jgi:hypothetical protein
LTGVRAPPTRTGPVAAKARPFGLQTKLAVGATHDRHEYEAERIATGFSQGSAPASAAPASISAVGAQRSALPVASAPEQTDDEQPAPPEARAQLSPRGGGPEAAKATPPQTIKAEPPEPEPEPDAKPASPAHVQRASQPDAPPGDVSTTSSTDGPAAPEPASDSAAPPVGGSTAAPASPGTEGGAAPAAVEQSIQQMRKGPAKGLDAPVRDDLEGHIGSDLGDVRLHDNRAAGEAAEALNARAFTVGQDIFFGPGQYDPDSSGGRHLIAHEVAHTVQQGGGSAAAQRIQRTPTTQGAATTPAAKDEAATDKVSEISGDGWSIKLEPVGAAKGTFTVPKLELPTIAGELKGSAGSKPEPAADGGRALPSAGASFKLDPVPERGEGKAFETWVAYAKSNFAAGLKTKLEAQILAQGNAASVAKSGAPVYVLYSGGKGAAGTDTMIIGTTQQLAEHDSLLRPMLSPKGARASLDADHALELQVGGQDSADNMWLLESGVNRSAGATVKSGVVKSIDQTLKAAQAELTKSKATPVSPLPASATEVRRNWVMVFNTVTGGKGGSTDTSWTRKQIREGEHLKHFHAMTEMELVKQGFVFKEGEVPTHINVFPGPSGGRAVRFAVSKDGSSLQKPSFFYRGFELIGDAPFNAPTQGNKGGVLSTLQVRRTKKKDKKSKVLVFADAALTVQHDENLGFGGYITRDSLTAAFSGAHFEPLSPISFSNVQITPDGEVVAEGSVLSSKQLLPSLNVPILLRGDDVLIQFPVPTESLNFGPVNVTEAAIELGVGENGFFIQGVAGIAVDQVGSGSLTARGENDGVTLGGVFNLDLDFLEKAEVSATYALKDDSFTAKAELQVKAGSLPGVESGSVTVEVTRESFGLSGSLNLGGVLKGSTVSIGYMPETGLTIEGKDLPLPVDKLPGVSGATVTVRAVRSPDSGEWKISGGGSAKLNAAGATATLDIFYDGESVTFKGRADVAKGPANGWLQITATNAATDAEGNPVEGGPVGELRIWGKGEASVAFGKVLTGKVGIEYTPAGAVILAGEIALPPTVDLFDKKEYTKSLLSVSTPDFPIWGVKVGPVGVGIFAYADADVSFNAYVGPGQLRDASLKAVMDLDKPEDATVTGKANFFVPSYAGLTLDVGGGLKAQVAVAYVKGRVGLSGTLGLGLDGSFGVDVSWNRNDGIAVGAKAEITARPKFEVGVNASVYAGVDLGITEIEKKWGPWTKKLGEFGPDMELGVSFPVNWSEKDGLDLSLDNISVKKPQLDAKGIIKSAFDTLV